MLKVLYTKINGALLADIASTLTLLPLDIVTLATLQANVNFAGGEWTYLRLDNDVYSEEVRVTDVQGSYAVVERGMSGSSPMAFSAIDTVVSDVVGVDAIEDIVEGVPVVSDTTVSGSGVATVTQVGDNYNVDVPALNISGAEGISVLGTFPNLQIALELSQGGCCPGEDVGGAGGGITILQLDSTILQGSIVGDLLTLALDTPIFTGAGSVAVTGAWPNYTITGAGGSSGGVTSVAVGDGLSLTGNPAVNPTISMANTGVVAGDYSGFVVNARGQITQVPAGFNPISDIVGANGINVARVGGSVTLTMTSADIAVPGVVALADHTAPLDAGDVQSAVTPALLAASLSSSGSGSIVAGSGTGEADALYTNVLSSTAIGLNIASGQRALLLGEVVVLDGTTPLTPVAYGIAIFDATNVRRYASKTITQSKQAALGFIDGPFNGTLSLVTTALPAGATLQSAHLAAVVL